jgi:hypothetical protein
VSLQSTTSELYETSEENNSIQDKKGKLMWQNKKNKFDVAEGSSIPLPPANNWGGWSKRTRISGLE